MRIRPFAAFLLCAYVWPASPLSAQQHDVDSAVAATAAQESHGQEQDHGGGEHGEDASADAVDIITPHITDSHELEIPCFSHGFACHVELPRWKPITIAGFEIDLSPTKHVVMLLIAATLCAFTLVFTAFAHDRHTHRVGHPRGFAAGLEAVVLYLRNEVVLPNIGPGGNAYVPFVLTLFFFILFANLLGLIPYGATATGNISVTATLAIITFLVIEVAGMRALGRHYIGTIIYWPHDMPLLMKVPMTLIMTPVEIISKFTKPFALAIRLFANMTAGHIVVLAFLGLIFSFGSYLLAGAPFLMAVGIMVLELFVAFLQAFIFALLASVFIGQIRTAHH
ncbi:MAG TPA: F0F1 ATP synthase subunit A [Gemmatimonadaceae bacterium]|nr:F0F1 ATP synthase subunit A [Gemmatimonadaceae bacterium]